MLLGKNMTKLEEAIIYLLSREKNSKMAILRLAKYLYLADYLYAKSFGNKQTFTGGYLRYSKGPVPNNFYNAIEKLKKENIRRDGNIITLTRGVRQFSLNNKEKACLDKIVTDFSDISLTKTVNISYNTEPMLEIRKLEKAIGDELPYENINFNSIKPHSLMNEETKQDKAEFDKYLKENE